MQPLSPDILPFNTLSVEFQFSQQLLVVTTFRFITLFYTMHQFLLLQLVKELHRAQMSSLYHHHHDDPEYNSKHCVNTFSFRCIKTSDKLQLACMTGHYSNSVTNAILSYWYNCHTVHRSRQWVSGCDMAVQVINFDQLMITQTESQQTATFSLCLSLTHRTV